MRATCCVPSRPPRPGGPARLLLTGLAILVASFVVFATVLVQQITERTVLRRPQRHPGRRPTW